LSAETRLQDIIWHQSANALTGLGERLVKPGTLGYNPPQATKERPMLQSAPSPNRRHFALLLAGATLAACARAPREPQASRGGLHPGESPEIHALIVKWARIHQIPESLIHRIIQRESGYNPAARNGPYYGLMQIMPQTAATMGYDGPASGLLDAETNLHYAGKYLRGAWLVSGGSQDRAVMWFSKGYYYEAKRQGLLRETGLKA